MIARRRSPVEACFYSSPQCQHSPVSVPAKRKEAIRLAAWFSSARCVGGDQVVDELTAGTFDVEELWRGS